MPPSGREEKGSAHAKLDPTPDAVIAPLAFWARRRRRSEAGRRRRQGSAGGGSVTENEATAKAAELGSSANRKSGGDSRQDEEEADAAAMAARALLTAASFGLSASPTSTSSLPLPVIRENKSSVSLSSLSSSPPPTVTADARRNELKGGGNDSSSSSSSSSQLTDDRTTTTKSLSHLISGGGEDVGRDDSTAGAPLASSPPSSSSFVSTDGTASSTAEDPSTSLDSGLGSDSKSKSRSVVSSSSSSVREKNVAAVATAKEIEIGNSHERGSSIDDGGGDGAIDVTASFDAFVRDAQALLESDQMRNLSSSSLRLASSASRAALTVSSDAARSAAHFALLPVTVPASAANDLARTLMDVAGLTAGMLLGAAGGAADAAVGYADGMLPLASALLDAAGGTAGTVLAVAGGAADSAVGYAAGGMPLLLDVAGETAGTVLGVAGGAADVVVGWYVGSGIQIPLLPPPSSAADTSNSSSSGEAQGQRQLPLLDHFGALLPLVAGAAGCVRDEVTSAALGLLGWQSAGQSSSEGGGDLGGRIGEAAGDCVFGEDHEDKDVWVECQGGEDASERRGRERGASTRAATTAAEEEEAAHDETDETGKVPPKRLRSFMRVCDLDVTCHGHYSASSARFVELLDKAEPQSSALDDDDDASQAMDALVRRGLALASSSGATTLQYPQWKPDKSTSQILCRLSSSSVSHSSFAANGAMSTTDHIVAAAKAADSGCPQGIELLCELEREVLLWFAVAPSTPSSSSKASASTTSSSSSSYGEGAPFFRGRGIVHGLSPADMADLLLDSDRVGEYNRYALSRTDEWRLVRRGRTRVSEEGEDAAADDQDAGDHDFAFRDVDARAVTKLVRSENRMPWGGGTVTLRNVMHARRLSDYVFCEAEAEAEAKVEREESNDSDHCVWDSDGEGDGSDGIDGDGDGRCEVNIKGYIIVSRSVGLGSDEFETESFSSQNEIIWGVNVLRQIPGRPNDTDLTVVSQVDMSGMVPGFLQDKVGAIGLGEFFRSVRALGEEKEKGRTRKDR